ncbi:MAG: aminoacyl-tRNA hydrolase [Bacteroidia bacterium]|nr:aminoacyl-tRNA hydrolase [Bacteroidia bacterium]MDW8088591.1 aminoacyl-tRNA hydrolase [Bacteroidia bacterium]
MKRRAVFGLGNPGPTYAKTRHNIGFRVVEALAQQIGAPPFTPQRYAEATHCTYRSIQWYLFRPTTYMNLSGTAVAYWKNALQLSLEELVVVLDELQLPLGALRLSPRGSAGGHKGLEHIIERLGTTEFPRLRLGIGKNFPKGQQVAYVLSPFTPEEEKILEEVIPRAVECLLAWALAGIDRAMSQHNRSLSTPPA